MKLPKSGLAVVVSGMLAAGCTTVVFTTKSSFGIDLDQTPASASIGYDRVEGFFGPRFAEGGVPAVVGAFVTQGNVLDRSVRQVYATGQAAHGVMGKTPTITTSALKNESDPMFFGTSTNFGLRLALSNQAISSFNVGYKRKEASVIPLEKKGPNNEYFYPSVLASLDTNYAVPNPPTTNVKAGVTQYFATGTAAEYLSQDEDIRASFKSLGKEGLLAYREQQGEQRRAALNTLYCLSLIDDAKLGQVWINVEKLKILDASIVTDLKAKNAKEARTMYTDAIRFVDADQPEYTGRLAGHQAFVCQLAGK